MKVEIICKACGNKFLVPQYRKDTAKYCSKKCHLYEGSSVNICEVCGADYRRAKSHNNFATKTCSLKCRGIATRKEVPSSNDYPSVRRWMLRRGLVKVCERCGFDEIPEILIVHHADRNRTNNALENLIILCPNCHAAEHYVENKNGWAHKSTKRRYSHAVKERNVAENYLI
jgi:5-methylcytosine-specific restriction endonuclease McrA